MPLKAFCYYCPVSISFTLTIISSLSLWKRQEAPLIAAMSLRVSLTDDDCYHLVVTEDSSDFVGLQFRNYYAMYLTVSMLREGEGGREYCGMAGMGQWRYCYIPGSSLAVPCNRYHLYTNTSLLLPLSPFTENSSDSWMEVYSTQLMADGHYENDAQKYHTIYVDQVCLSVAIMSLFPFSFPP